MGLGAIVSVIVGVNDGVGEGTVAVGVNVAVAVGVLVAKMALNGFFEPVATETMISMPASASKPAKTPRMYGILFCRLENLLITFCGLSFLFIGTFA